jgi:hypothetical protein
MNHFKRCLVSLLIVSTALAGVPVTAQAGLVTTDEVLPEHATITTASTSRERVDRFLARDDVRQALQVHGVRPQDAAERVRAMSDDEVEQLAGRVDHAPAGGDVVGVLFTVFIVLLVTDIMGLTKVFPFTRSVR